MADEGGKREIGGGRGKTGKKGKKKNRNRNRNKNKNTTKVKPNQTKHEEKYCAKAKILGEKKKGKKILM